MPDWTAIRIRAAEFAERHKRTKRERSDSQTFWYEFFVVLGLSPRAVSLFEWPVTSSKRMPDYVDVLCPKKLLIEHKSAGVDIDPAMDRAKKYCRDLDKADVPRYLLSCNFQRWYLLDLDTSIPYKFELAQLPENIHLFAFMLDADAEPEPVRSINVRASEKMAQLHDALRESGYPESDMDYLLTRLTFCMFADHIGIFEPHQFTNYLKRDMLPGAADTGPKLVHLFEVLNTPHEMRQGALDGGLAAFPYINGDLFGSPMRTPAFTLKSRNLLLDAAGYNWSEISPVIFGALFQETMNKDERRMSGAHYTPEDSIMKVIRPLFLDDLEAEFRSITIGINRRRRLIEFHEKLAGMTFFDPACGAGNFLITAYKCMRRLETRVIKMLHGDQHVLDARALSKVDVDRFYGIEVNPFSAKIAETAMWMIDHIMNEELGRQIGLTVTRIPIEKSPVILCGDALETDWNEFLPRDGCSYVLGNPPFGGSKFTDDLQKAQTSRITGSRTLDYVSNWFVKAAEYSEAEPNIRIGFVATNSITQGEQVGQLWPRLLDGHGLKIEFAYRPFVWTSEAPNKAHVHVVIIGLGRGTGRRRLFYADGDEVLEDNPQIISPYLFGTDKTRIVRKSSNQLNGLPIVKTGSKPIDGNHYIFTDSEKEEFLKAEPLANQYMRKYVGGREYIRGTWRWILALQDASPAALNALPAVKKRMELVREHRLASKAPSTRDMAETPQMYHLNVIPVIPYLAIPEVSSERRRYVPIGYLKPPTIPTNKLKIVENASLGLFGLLTSYMHGTWLAGIGGRMKSDYDYSIHLVYNTFPIPDVPLDDLGPPAQAVLDARAAHPTSTLYDLYDPVTMPPDLAKAHRRLDRKVDGLYRRERFHSDIERIEFLLTKYEEMVGQNT